MRGPSKKIAAKAKKTTKAEDTAKAKKSKKKKKKAAGAKVGPSARVLGCCTLVGSGPDVQIEGITESDCDKRAAALGKNPIWTPGKCAQPN